MTFKYDESKIGGYKKFLAVVMKRYFKRKSIADLVSDSEKSSKLERSLGAFQLLMLGIGAIVGAGIFVLAGTAASQNAGPAVVISFILSGLACSCAGLCYAELSTLIPVSGSTYNYMYATLGELVAWVVAFLAVIGNMSLIASVACGWSGYVTSLLSDFGLYISPIFSNTSFTEIVMQNGSSGVAIFNVPAFLIVIAIGFILYFGVQTSATINTFIVIVKMSVLIAFVIVGAFKVDVNNWIPFIPKNLGEFGKFGLSGIVGGATMVLLAFNGFDAVATAAQETKNPQRDLPIGIIGALIISTLIYVLISGVLTGLVDYRELNVAQPIALATDKMGMPWFSLVIKAGAIIGLSSVILVMTYGIIRITYAVSCDGLLPSAISVCHSKYHTPHVITIILGLTIAFISAMVPLDNLVQLSNFCTIVVFGLVCFVTLYLRYKEPNADRSFKCPMMPFIPLAGIFLFSYILLGMPQKIYMYFGILVLIAVSFYFVYGYRNSNLRNL